MSEVVDPVAEAAELEAGKCFGEWDGDDVACLKKCDLRVQCETKTKMAGKVKADPPPALDQDDGLMEADPGETLMGTLRARYDIETSKAGAVTESRCSCKDGTFAVLMRAHDDGSYYFRTNEAELQLERLESARQAISIFQAILVV